MERDAEAFLTALDEKLPELEIVAYVIHVDVEYTGEGTPTSSALQRETVVCIWIIT